MKCLRFSIFVIIITIIFISANRVDASTINKPTNFLGMVGYWTFDGSDIIDTTAFDKSGQGNDGTLTNGPTKTVGKVGQAIKLDGVDDVVSISQSSSINDLPSMTIAFWAKSDTLGINRPFLVKADNASGGHGWSLQSDTSVSSRLNFTVHGFTTSDLNVVSNSDVIVADETAHYVVTWDGSNQASGVHLYKNGQELTYVTTNNGGSASPQSDAGRDLKIGRESGIGSNYFNGSVDDVRIYNRALSSGEVASLYNSGQAKANRSTNDRLTDGLVALWSFDGKDIIDTTALNQGGSGNNGTLTNSPTKTIGKIGQALSFDGTNDYVDVGSGLNQSTYTVSAWIKPNAMGALKVVAGKVSVYELDVDGSNKILCAVGNGTAWGSPYAYSGTYTDGEWQHVACVYDGTNLTAYLDGVPGTSVTPNKSPPGSSSNNVRIGEAGNGGSFYFNGLIDDVRIYDRALSDAEMKQLYTLGGGSQHNASRLYFLKEDAEGSGTPAGWTDAGTVDWDYTTDPIEGDETLHVYSTVSSFQGPRWDGTFPDGEFWLYTVMRWGGAGSNKSAHIVFLRDSDDASQHILRINTSGIMTLRDINDVGGTGSVDISGYDKIHVWLHRFSDGNTEAYISNNTTRPSSPQTYSTSAENAGLTGAVQFSSSRSVHIYYDHIRLSASEIGSNPD